MSKRGLAAMSKTEQKMPTRVVVIFAYDGAQLIDIAGPTQALTTANEEGASPPYAVRLAAISSGPIRTASGGPVASDSTVSRLSYSERLARPTTVLCRRSQAGQLPLGAWRHLQRVPAKRPAPFTASSSRPQVSLRPKRSRSCDASLLGPCCKPRH